MRWIETRRFLKSVEYSFRDQSKHAQQVELVGSRYDNEPSRFGQTPKLSKKCPRVFEMFDRFNGRNDLRDLIRERNIFRVEVRLNKDPFGRKVVIAYYISGKVSPEHGFDV